MSALVLWILLSFSQKYIDILPLKVLCHIAVNITMDTVMLDPEHLTVKS